MGKVFGRSLLPGDFEFSIAQLQVALDETKYCGVEVAALVEKYFNEKILSNSQRREEKTELNKRFWEEVLHEAGSRFGKDAGELYGSMK